MTTTEPTTEPTAPPARFVLMRHPAGGTIAVNLDHVLTIEADPAITVDSGRRRAPGSIVTMTGGVTLQVRDNFQHLVATALGEPEPDEPEQPEPQQ